MTATQHQEKKSSTIRIVCTAVPILALLAGFAYWLYTGSAVRIASVVSAAALLFLFAVCLIRFVPQWQRAWSGEPIPAPNANAGRRSGRKRRMHPFFRIAFTVALSRIVLFLAAYLLLYRQNGYTGGVFDCLSLWASEGSNAADYLLLAARWYDAESGLLTLFPFYPALLRVLGYVFQNTLVTGLFVSNMAFVFAACLLYELALFDMERNAALRAVVYLCLLPGSLLFMQPLPDSLFLLLSVASLYFVRKKRYLFAALLGMFAAFTHLLGVLLLLPALIELIGELRTDRLIASDMRALSRAYTGRFLALLLIPAGFGLYLYINWQISGDPFRFIAAYRARGQGFSFFFQAAAQQILYLLQSLRDQNLHETVVLWGANLLALFGSLAILIPAIPRLRSSYSAYFLAAFALIAGVSPFVCLPRCLAMLFPLPLAFSCAAKKRIWHVLFMALLLAFLPVYLYAFVRGWRLG